MKMTLLKHKTYIIFSNRENTRIVNVNRDLFCFLKLCSFARRRSIRADLNSFSQLNKGEFIFGLPTFLIVFDQANKLRLITFISLMILSGVEPIAMQSSKTTEPIIL